MSSSDEGNAIAMVVVFFLGLSVLAGGMMYALGRSDMYEADCKQAVEAGVAHYEVDSQTGDTTFVYGIEK